MPMKTELMSAQGGFGNVCKEAFVDVRIFYPFAQSYRNQALSATFRSMERAKKKKYNSKVMENEHGTFTPLIFSTNGDMGREAKVFYARLSELIAEKYDNSLPETMAWEKRKIRFGPLRTTVICLRGSRSRKNIVPLGDMRDIVQINEDSKIER